MLFEKAGMIMTDPVDGFQNTNLSAAQSYGFQVLYGQETFPQGSSNQTGFDATCDYECMATEYFYWALTSILGAQSYPSRLQEISNEWELNTRDLVRNGNPDVFSLLTDPAWRLPTVLPDGTYGY